MYQKLLILFIIIGYLCDKYKFDAVVTVNDLGINKTSNGKRVVSDNNEVKTLINSRYTNPCSINEYQSCYCDYKIVNLNLYSITINCQFKSNDYDSSTKISYHHHHHQHQHQHDSIQLLQQQQQPHNDYSLNLHIKYIPRINTTNYNYINSINYLDLSKTLINEIQTDAFHGMHGLQTLVITNCPYLTQIKMFAFRGLKSLKKLIITNNKNLFQIDAHAFGTLKHLDYLSLNMNNLSEINGHIFSQSNTINTIEFLGNPIRKIKSHAFHGLRNVTNLILSTNENQTNIELIEADSFISTAFVNKILLQNITTKILNKNAFRGLSNCYLLDLSNSFIETIETHTFYRTHNINYLNLSNCGIRSIDDSAFQGISHINNINLEGNYISNITELAYLNLILDYMNYNNNTKSSLTTTVKYENNKISNELPEETNSIGLLYNNVKKNEKFLNFERNPIKCDCSVKWLIANRAYLEYILLPEFCSGPSGYDCLPIGELKVNNLAACDSRNTQINDTPPCKNLKTKLNDKNDSNEDETLGTDKEDENIDDDESSETIEVINSTFTPIMDKTIITSSARINIKYEETTVTTKKPTVIASTARTLNSLPLNTKPRHHANVSKIRVTTQKNNAYRFALSHENVFICGLFTLFNLFYFIV